MYETDPELKLVVIECIEATGNIALVPFSEVGEEIYQRTGKKCLYFSASHYAVESGHIQGGVEDVEELLDGIELTAETRIKALDIVEKVFEGFTESMNEMMDYVVRHGHDRPNREEARAGAS